MIDTTKMVRLGELAASEVDDSEELEQYGREATAFLQSHKWCGSIRQKYFDRGWAGILGIFYFKIEPASAAVDDEVWVVVGDLPPAYIDVKHCTNGAQALYSYVAAMREWVHQVKRGESVGEQIPVYYRFSRTEIEPTPEFADMLESRLKFVEEQIMPEFQDELNE
jgi:hypothetical protein